ncbi:MAG: hypothetical protein NC089_06100 [Bacteroides sp.]|nr:hypothetical protein [Bacteroides sp.]MCM1550014.1 hypothetical protein [Clostridium sp.]
MAVSGIDTSAASTVASKTKETGSNTLDKDAFLKLLVTQMQYQDPLEPTDNTEWMSQMAQFSQMEAMNNLNTAFSNTQALGLVGEYVLLNVTDSAGAQKQIGGLVQYVTISNNQALLRVNDEYYPMENLDSVVDLAYLDYLNGLNANETTEGEENGENNGNVEGEGGEA